MENGQALRRITDFYIDLGTANTLVYIKGSGLVINEPTVLTVQQKTSKFFEHSAFGKNAKEMLGKTPLSMHSIRPLKEGVISDFEQACKLVEFFMKNIGQKGALRKARSIISLPCQVTRHEKQAIRDLGKSLGVGGLDLITEPMAAAIGSGFDVLESKGKMVVDIGGGTSETAIISLGGIVSSQAERVGGVGLDEAIIDHLKFKYHFYIGEQTAENLKILVGSALADSEDVRECEIGGIDLKTGLPRKMVVTSVMIFPPINQFVKKIISLVSKALEECLPEISGDLSEDGIFLTGGGSLLRKLPERISKEIGIKVARTTHPLYSVSAGGAKVLEDHKLFDRLQAG
ncbi:MAG: rod shape-determining protein [Bdellovibrionales bacterium]|nr:rod shape-determining protein [Bdellovibrionales bacterium]